eukprot:sb/3472216/
MVAMKNQWIYRAMVVRMYQHRTWRSSRQWQTEFNKYFTWLQNGRQGPEHHSPNNPLFNPPYPTLSELINFIKRTRVANGHWNPAWSWCNMCTNKFDYVIKLEEEPMELWFLLDKLGLWKDRALFLAHSNTSNSTAKHNSELNQLQDHQKKWINSYYENDLKMFGYDRVT